jgi:hypothetical protein
VERRAWECGGAGWGKEPKGERTGNQAPAPRAQEQDKIAALDPGADDYLTKPFAVGELMARLGSVRPVNDASGFFCFRSLGCVLRVG